MSSTLSVNLKKKKKEEERYKRKPWYTFSFRFQFLAIRVVSWYFTLPEAVLLKTRSLGSFFTASRSGLRSISAIYETQPEKFKCVSLHCTEQNAAFFFFCGERIHHCRSRGFIFYWNQRGCRFQSLESPTQVHWCYLFCTDYNMMLSLCFWVGLQLQ